MSSINRYIVEKLALTAAFTIQIALVAEARQRSLMLIDSLKVTAETALFTGLMSLVWLLILFTTSKKLTDWTWKRRLLIIVCSLFLVYLVICLFWLVVDLLFKIERVLELLVLNFLLWFLIYLLLHEKQRECCRNNSAGNTDGPSQDFNLPLQCPCRFSEMYLILELELLRFDSFSSDSRSHSMIRIINPEDHYALDEPDRDLYQNIIFQMENSEPVTTISLNVSETQSPRVRRGSFFQNLESREEPNEPVLNFLDSQEERSVERPHSQRNED